MKIPRIRIIETMLVVSVVSLVALAAIVLSPYFMPAPLRYLAFQVIDAPPAVIATTKRLNVEGCTNGPQADLMDAGGVLTRLPVPARSVRGQTTVYPLVIPDGISRGRYAVQVRENFLCAGRDPQSVESPWLPLVVK